MINKQDFINAVNYNIDMVRGDSLAFNFQLTGLGSKSDYEILNFTFAAAEHYDDDSIIEVTNEDGITLENYNEVKDVATFSVYIDPTKTKTLDLIRYYYDLQLNTETDVITLMRGRLCLLYDVAD